MTQHAHALVLIFNVYSVALVTGLLKEKRGDFQERCRGTGRTGQRLDPVRRQEKEGGCSEGELFASPLSPSLPGRLCLMNGVLIGNDMQLKKDKEGNVYEDSD